ncbi:hypothetical protein L6452_03142 [Arctium lappa]|uniref:Uncharacterized protein n=1 Tax=Arctium lappa TaxID=4217 RepID=A0ACB9FKV1_ARCLA|nr:hypothetical protein L6452_03142 [Arctium lappa]
MGLVIRALILIGMVVCLTSVAHAIAGEATYYTVYTPSSCYGNEDHGNMIAAVNSGLFANKAACGRRYRDVQQMDSTFRKRRSPLLLILVSEESTLIIPRYENTKKWRIGCRMSSIRRVDE